MNPIQITDWHVFLRDGKQFLKTARQAHLKKKKSFSAESIYNLTCMGIEKLIMAFLMQRGDLADNHTMEDLLNSLERHLTIEPEIKGQLRYLDSFQEICDLDSYVVRQPNTLDLIKITAIGGDLQRYLEPHLNM